MIEAGEDLPLVEEPPENNVRYGLTSSGGLYDHGVAYELDPGAAPATIRVLHSFGEIATDGAFPVGALTEVQGLLYGVTQHGGQYQGGTLFRLDGAGLLFQQVADLQMYPYAGLIAVGLDLYGTTQQGGNGYGSIFRFETATDYLDYVHAFDNSAGGSSAPVASLIQALNGRLYGTTEGGGAHGHGTLFEVNLSSSPLAVTTRHSFAPASTGSRPVAGLVEAAGLLYGTTSDFGPGFNGTVYRFDPASGATALVAAFGPSGPHQPSEPVVEANGMFFGTSYQGGSRRSGTVFSWDAATSTTAVLHSFDAAVDGAYPQGPVIVASDGRLYGTTWFGGQRPVGWDARRTSAEVCSGWTRTGPTTRSCDRSTRPPVRTRRSAACSSSAASSTARSRPAVRMTGAQSSAWTRPVAISSSFTTFSLRPTGPDPPAA
jgi:uncharacterized repeat protein (TIGR03803 family)